MRELANRYAVLWGNTLAFAFLAGWQALNSMPGAPYAGAIVVGAVVIFVGAVATFVIEGGRRLALRRKPHA